MARFATVRPERGVEPGSLLEGDSGSPALPDDPWQATWSPRTPGPTQIAEIRRWEREHRTSLEEWSARLDIAIDLEEPSGKPEPTPSRRGRRRERATRSTASASRSSRRTRRREQAAPPERHLRAVPDRRGNRFGRTFTAIVYLAALTAAASLWYFSLGTLLVSRGTALASGWEVTTIATGSMRPALDPGDLVAYAPIDPADFKRNMIIVFDNPAVPGGTIVHRLVAFNGDGTLTTKGDANADADSTPISPDAVRGQVKMVSPYGGFPNMLLHRGDAAEFAALVGILLGAAILVHGPTPRFARHRDR